MELDPPCRDAIRPLWTARPRPRRAYCYPPCLLRCDALFDLVPSYPSLAPSRLMPLFHWRLTHSVLDKLTADLTKKISAFLLL
ncbi:MAG: hypothetical protein EB114_07795 [Betaproteobacteria bacterium]|nr:hypothetical protein [Betaproteobacteria bacterium]NBQ82085.1 hypothetical protein [Betaproteobacteria bacterium]NBS22083.1 hypothetical protein [Betaproteobacteria bacterium]NBT65699.1 hypothetical protein [Betaproteobacteria bacterium]NBU02240.1 hypothetical protein [Betaproteobacteria bacterium]